MISRAKYMSRYEAGKVLAVEQEVIDRLIRQGKLSSLKRGHFVYVTREQVEKIKREQK